MCRSEPQSLLLLSESDTDSVAVSASRLTTVGRELASWRMPRESRHYVVGFRGWARSEAEGEFFLPQSGWPLFPSFARLVLTT